MTTPIWELKLDEYTRVLDKLAVKKPELSYLDDIKKRIEAQAFLETTGTVKERESKFYASEVYQEWVNDRRALAEEMEHLLALRSALQAWFELWRTDESTRREEMRLAR